MYGSASARICALSAVATASCGMAERMGKDLGLRSFDARIVLRTASFTGAWRKRPGSAFGIVDDMASPLPDPVALGEIERVLVTKLRHHGDVLLTSPVFTVLKRAAPHVAIDALVYRETAPMLA